MLGGVYTHCTPSNEWTHPRQSELRISPDKKDSPSVYRNRIQGSHAQERQLFRSIFTERSRLSLLIFKTGFIVTDKRLNKLTIQSDVAIPIYVDVTNICVRTS